MLVRRRVAEKKSVSSNTSHKFVQVRRVFQRHVTKEEIFFGFCIKCWTKEMQGRIYETLCSIHMNMLTCIFLRSRDLIDQRPGPIMMIVA